ncbi:PiggyBac_transposable element-derived protein [Hexamita inflata]|uniref:PiggyBac transposable element-derived protein n=1 Tax=Hexamita inflata TaxID=28002 RepID=A0AA86RAT1_9EUKA|nr:PiggyBac transposable element-derived protein [Hexamita inflata]
MQNSNIEQQRQIAFKCFNTFFDHQITSKVIELTIKNMQKIEGKISFDEQQYWSYLSVIFTMWISPRSDFSEYWSYDVKFSCPFIQQIMSQNKFSDIHTNIGFDSEYVFDSNMPKETQIIPNWILRAVKGTIQRMNLLHFALGNLSRDPGFAYLDGFNPDPTPPLPFVRPDITPPYYLPDMNSFFQYHLDLLTYDMNKKLSYRQKFMPETVGQKGYVKKYVMNQFEVELNKQIEMFQFKHKLTQGVKIVMYCLQVSVVNARILFQSKTGTEIKLRDFTELLIDQMAEMGKIGKGPKM